MMNETVSGKLGDVINLAWEMSDICDKMTYRLVEIGEDETSLLGLYLDDIMQTARKCRTILREIEDALPDDDD